MPAQKGNKNKNHEQTFDSMIVNVEYALHTRCDHTTHTRALCFFLKNILTKHKGIINVTQMLKYNNLCQRKIYQPYQQFTLCAFIRFNRSIYFGEWKWDEMWIALEFYITSINWVCGVCEFSFGWSTCIAYIYAWILC